MAGSNIRRRHPSYYRKRRRRRRHHPYKQRDNLAQQQQQQDQRKREDISGQCSMDSSASDSDDIHTPVPVPLLDIGITSWLPLPELGGALRWCSYRVAQSLNWVKDTIFPSRIYWRELQETKDQLLQLHQQIEQLKAQTMKDENQRAVPTCACKCQPLAVASGPHWIQQPAIDPTMDQERSQSGVGIPPTVSAAPPPPPPPPPIAEPAKPLVFKKKTSQSAGSANVTKQQPMITLSDIMNVKLKKVSCHVDADMQVSADPVESRAMTNIMNIQLKKSFKHKQAVGSTLKGSGEFKEVRLKRRKSMNRRHDENTNSMVLRSRISEEAIQFRGNLRKVRGIRSPGGTPLRGKSKESHGTGLTPLMTTALRRKFKTVRTPSPSTQGISSSSSPLFNLSD